jgi:hypothetical protein
MNKWLKGVIVLWGLALGIHCGINKAAEGVVSPVVINVPPAPVTKALPHNTVYFKPGSRLDINDTFVCFNKPEDHAMYCISLDRFMIENQKGTSEDQEIDDNKKL